MGLFDIFKKKKEDSGPDPLHDLVLEKMQAGYLVDYDMKTWEVTARHRYDFDGDIVLEWELKSGSEVRYLERSFDDEVEWSFSQKIPIGALGGDVRRHIIDHEDPPAQIQYKAKTYYLDDDYAGYYYKDDAGSPQELIKWEFVDEDQQGFVTIEQWGETEFEASAGIGVEEYQFTSILPGGG